MPAYSDINSSGLVAKCRQAGLAAHHLQQACNCNVLLTHEIREGVANACMAMIMIGECFAQLSFVKRGAYAKAVP